LKIPYSVEIIQAVNQQETTKWQQGNLGDISPINVISHIGFHRYRVGNGNVIHDISSEEHFEHLKISRSSDLYKKLFIFVYIVAAYIYYTSL
jgi:hypothetical protein